MFSEISLVVFAPFESSLILGVFSVDSWLGVGLSAFRSLWSSASSLLTLRVPVLGWMAVVVSWEFEVSLRLVVLG